MRALITSILLAVMVLSVQQLNAQEEKTLLETEKIAQRLDLDEIQKSELDKVLKQNREQRRARMEMVRKMREEMKRDAFLERQSQQERLAEILTDEQMQKLKSMRDRRPSREDLRQRGNRRGDERIQRFLKDRNLERRGVRFKERVRENRSEDNKGGN